MVVATNRYSKPTNSIPISRATAPLVATVLLEHCIIPYGIPNTLLTDYDPPFVSKFFATLCVSFDTKPVMTAEYHSQSNGHLKRFNKKLAA